MSTVYESLEAGAKSAGQASFEVKSLCARKCKMFSVLDHPSARMRSLEQFSVIRYLEAAFLNQGKTEFVRVPL